MFTIERRDKENRSKPCGQFGKCGPMKRYGTLGNYRAYIITIAPVRNTPIDQKQCHIFILLVTQITIILNNIIENSISVAD